MNHEDISQEGMPTEASVSDELAQHLYGTLRQFEELTSRLQYQCQQLDEAIYGREELENIMHPMHPDELHLGVLGALMEDPDINDIMVNGPGSIYVERSAGMELTDLSFESDEELYTVAEHIARFNNRTLDPKTPCMDGRLPDGSRINVAMPPVSLNGVCLSIRKFRGDQLNLRTLVEYGAMSEQMADFLRVCSEYRANILISGGTGVGKTTLLNAVCAHIPHDERVITIEDTAELQLPIPHVVTMEAVTNPNPMMPSITIRELIKNAMRMRPDRIVIGESRGAEAFDMIQAMNTGHNGSLTTVHANSPREALSRMENLINMADVNLPQSGVRRLIADAIHMIVQLERDENGRRYVKAITEIVSMEGDVISTQEIFTRREQQMPDGAINSHYVWNNIFPRHHKINQAVRDAGILKIKI